MTATPQPSHGLRVLGLVVAGVAAFAANQAAGVTLPVHLIGTLGGTATDVGLVAGWGTAGVILGRGLSAFVVKSTSAPLLGLGSMALTVVASLLYTFFQYDIGLLAAARALHGAAFAGATTALFVGMAVARTGSPQRAMALANLAMPTALAIFPVVAVEALGARLLPVAVMCGAVACVGALAFALKPEPLSQRTVPAPSSPTTCDARRLPIALLCAAALLGAADAAMMDFLPVLARARGIDGFGWAFSVFAAATIVLLAAISRGDVPRTNASLVIVGAALTSTGLLLLPAVGTLALLLPVIAVYGFGFATMLTGVNSVAAESGAAGRVGGSLATILLTFDIGRGAGVYLLGLAIEGRGFAQAFVPLACVLLAFGVAAGLVSRPRRGRPLA